MSLIGVVIEELILFLYGPSGSGKSSCINTMMAMFGPELGIKIPTSALLTGVRGGNTELSAIAKLRGARFASCSELPQKRSFNESAVKDLSSRDIIFAKALYSSPIQFLPSHMLFLYGNQKPSVSASDSGFWRRMKEIPFNEAIPESEMDANLDQKLLRELAGIFNWAIQGCLAYQKDGLASPKAIRRATKHYQSEVDVIGRFIPECTVKGKQAELAELAKEIERQVKDWQKVTDGYQEQIRQLNEEMQPKRNREDDVVAELRQREIRDYLRTLDPVDLEAKFIAAAEQGDELFLAAVEESPVPFNFATKNLVEKVRFRRLSVAYPVQAQKLADLQTTKESANSALKTVRHELA